MITDRDIAIRAVAEGKAPTTKVRDIMSEEVLYCFDDQDLDEVAQNMSEMKIRRLPVVNRDKRLVGIISLGDLARNEDASKTGRDGFAHLANPAASTRRPRTEVSGRAARSSRRRRASPRRTSSGTLAASLSQRWHAASGSKLGRGVRAS